MEKKIIFCIEKNIIKWRRPRDKLNKKKIAKLPGQRVGDVKKKKKKKAWVLKKPFMVSLWQKPSQWGFGACVSGTRLLLFQWKSPPSVVAVNRRAFPLKLKKILKKRKRKKKIEKVKDKKKKKRQKKKPEKIFKDRQVEKLKVQG